MSRLLRAIPVALLIATPVAMPAWAHHGWSGQEEKVTSLTGTVVQGVSLAGPHASMKIKVGTEVWDITFAPPARTASSGLKEGLIPVGATVTVRGNRSTEPGRHEMKTIYLKQGTAEYHVYPERE